ncbi:MAG: acyl carrier protein [Bacillota bacterium]|nr:acyl carrier protein [Bacillota bacterium]
MTDNLGDRLIRLIKDKFDVDKAANISMEDSLLSLNMNSISFIKLVVEVEKEFGIHFKNNEIDINDFPTLESILEFIQRKI